MKNRVLVYEDNERLRDSIVSMLDFSDDFGPVCAYANCISVEQQIKEFEPGIILMDIDMVEMSGIEAVKLIRRFNTDVQILMITIFEDSQNVFEAICAGANGYLLKKYISNKLISAMKECLEGGAPMSPSIARMVVGKMHNHLAPKPDYALTERETETLKSLAQGNSYKMIADELSISIDTVRTHIKRIYEKLHVHSQTEAIVKAIRENIV
jgi:DNA-binding NarL/FixJ family response regulator